MNVLFANDTSGYHSGCDLTVKVFKDQLLKNGHTISPIELKCPSFAYNKWEINDKLFNNIDVVAINGEGTFHRNTRGATAIYELASHAKRLGKKVVLLNTVIDKITFDLSIFDYISCRESFSAQGKYDIAHDLCFYDEVETREDGDYILITDGISNGLRNLQSSVPNSQYCVVDKCGYSIEQLHDLFKNASKVITGRYHGVVFSMLHNKPFLCVSSNTHKIEGLLKDMNMSSRLCKTDGECLLKLENLKRPNIDINKIRNDIDNMFIKAFE